MTSRMTPIKPYLYAKSFICVMLLICLGIADCSLPGWAQNFSGKGRPRRSTGGASRGGCPQTPKPLTALAPIAADSGGKTTQTHPSFWVYVPYQLSPETLIKLVLRDEQDQDVYEAELTGSAISPGIVGLTLPTDAPALELGKSYTWYFEVYCRKNDAPAFVSGWIERVALDASTMKQLQQATPLQRSDLYAKELVWYDALSTLAEARRTKPNDPSLNSRWQTLLRLPSVGLDRFVSEPLIPFWILDLRF